jgi:hypothetical protein
VPLMCVRSSADARGTSHPIGFPNQPLLGRFVGPAGHGCLRGGSGRPMVPSPDRRHVVPSSRYFPASCGPSVSSTITDDSLPRLVEVTNSAWRSAEFGLVAALPGRLSLARRRSTPGDQCSADRSHGICGKEFGGQMRRMWGWLGQFFSRSPASPRVRT